MKRMQPRPAGRPFSRYALALWQRSPRGRRLMTLEERELRRVLPDMFGRHALQLGHWDRDGRLLSSAATLHRATLGSHSRSGAAAQVQLEQLPLLEKSVDVMLLPHSLEFSSQPRHLLREASRALTDRGSLVVLGFNPWSVWGARRWLGARYRAFPEGARFYTAGRVCDWLELLSFEVSEIRRYGIGFPWLQPADDGLLSATQEAWMIVARKRVLPMNWVGRVRRARVSPLVKGVPMPSARIDAGSDGDLQG